MAPAVLASRVVLHQVDTLTLVVGAVGWFLSYELPVRRLPRPYNKEGHREGSRNTGRQMSPDKSV